MNISTTYIRMLPAAALIAVSGLLSCGHKEIECPASIRKIDILFEWDKARNADVDGMTLFFYPLDGHNRVWRFDIAGRDGGPVELPPGIYSMVACNNDLPGIVLMDTGSETTVRAGTARMTGDRTYAGTGMLYGGIVERLEVSPCGVRYTGADGSVKECVRGLVRCQPDSLSTRYDVEITDVTGTGRIRSAAARLGPVAPSILLMTGKPAGDPSWLSMPLKADGTHMSLTGSGCAFDAGTEPRLLSVAVTKTDGKTITRTFTITPDNLNIISRHNVLISVGGLNIDDGGNEPSGDVGGIEAGVEGWDVIEIDL